MHLIKKISVLCLALSLIGLPPVKAEKDLLPLDQIEKNEHIASAEVSPLEEILQQENNNQQEVTVLKGSVTKVVDREEKISVSLMTVLSSEFNHEGDSVEAKILVKPTPNEGNALKALRGSKIIGHVVEVKPSRRGGRSGYVKVAFDTLKLKTGKEFPIKAELTTETFKGKEAAKMVLYDAKLITLGALWGTYNSLKWSPIAAFSTNGLSVALSAGIGMSLGVIGSIRRQGTTKSFFPGERSNIEFKDSLNLSEEDLSEAALASQQLQNDLIGLKLQLLETNFQNSEEYENLLSVKVKVDNRTDSSIYPCDLLLIPRDGGDPVMPDLRISGAELLKSIRKGEESTVTLMFPINKKINLTDYNLALVDPLDKAFLSQLPLNKR